MRASAAVVVPVAGFKSLTQVREAGARLWRSMFASPAAGTITGTVFQDYNGNGNRNTTLVGNNVGGGTFAEAIDNGIQGVTVTATCVVGLGADGVIGTPDDVLTTYPSVVSDASGNYSIATTGAVVNARACRLEFSTLPAGYQYGPEGVTNATATQFVADNATGINFGISYPADYCQNIPEILTPCYVFGDQVTGPNANDVVLLTSPYSAGTLYTNATVANHDLPTTHAFVALANDVGTTYGVAYRRSDQRIYAAAYMKKHSGFGPGADGLINTTDDPGAIYVLNRTTGALITTFTVPNATTNTHNTANYISDNFNTAFGAVAKTSLGGIAMSEDDSRLYVMNLENRTLYALDSTTGATLASQAVPATLPLIAPSTIATCNPGDVRPFAVKVHHGSLYVGLVCSAESSATVDTFVDGSNGQPLNSRYDFGETFTDNDGNAVFNRGDVRQLQGFVYSVDPVTLAFAPAPAFQLLLGYPRGKAYSDPPTFAEWRPWISTFDKLGPIASSPSVYPQPILSDISFDAAGNLTLGIRDRYGDQMGNIVFSNPLLPGFGYGGITSGDTVKACANGSGWTLESNGRCGGTGTAP